MNETNNEVNNLRDHVRRTLTAEQFDKLPEMMGLTPTATTRLLNRPSTEANVEQVKELAKILGCTPKYLVCNYWMGYATISLEEAEELGIKIA